MLSVQSETAVLCPRDRQSEPRLKKECYMLSVQGETAGLCPRDR